MDKDILLATDTLVESVCHYIRDPSGVFSVSNARKWHKFPKWSTSSRFVELSDNDIYHFWEQQNKCCLLVFIVDAYLYFKNNFFHC